jgi:hypothetical protein
VVLQPQTSKLLSEELAVAATIINRVSLSANRLQHRY